MKAPVASHPLPQGGEGWEFTVDRPSQCTDNLAPNVETRGKGEAFPQSRRRSREKLGCGRIGRTSKNVPTPGNGRLTPFPPLAPRKRHLTPSTVPPPNGLSGLLGPTPSRRCHNRESFRPTQKVRGALAFRQRRFVASCTGIFILTLIIHVDIITGCYCEAPTAGVRNQESGNHKSKIGNRKSNLVRWPHRRRSPL